MAWQSPWGYQMWTCDACGCLAIAASLETCPMCGKEREMPRATRTGFSNAWESPPPETARAAAPAEPPPAAGQESGSVTVSSAPAEPTEPPPPVAADEDEEPADYASYPVKVLRDLARERGLSVSAAGGGGYLPKDGLVAALTAWDSQQAGVT